MGGLFDARGRNAPGVIPSQQIETMIASGQMRSACCHRRSRCSPLSLDLRLGTVAYRVRASFLAGQVQRRRAAAEFRDAPRLTCRGRGLGKGLRLLVPLMEGLDLPGG